MQNIFFESGGDGSTDVGLFPVGPANRPWDEVFAGSWDELVARFDLVLECRDGAPVKLVGRRSQSVAFVYRSMESLAQADTATGATNIFAPGPLAVLDAIRDRRETLVFAKPLPAGSQITDDSLATRQGGTGINAGLKEIFIGATLLYDVREGQALDFGLAN